MEAMYTCATVKLCIQYKSSFSHFFTAHIGLKQGDLTSQLLFMLFINDIDNNVNENLNGVFIINELKLFLILFADDTLVFAQSPKILQSMQFTIYNLLVY